MAMPPEPRDFNKLAADWARLQMAAMSDRCEPTRSYDRRYQSEISHERACLEAMLAAALAREYIDKGADPRPPAAGPSG